LTIIELPSIYAQFGVVTLHTGGLAQRRSRLRIIQICPLLLALFRSLRRFGYGTFVVMPSLTMIDQNPDLKEKLTRVLERATQDAIALLLSQRDSEKPSDAPIPEWMTASQLARYWQLVNASGEATTAGIMKWARRPDDEHPLPHAYMGDLLRFHRVDVDVWAREGADRRRVQNEQRRLGIA
jgi:hypothetical protein